MKKLFAAAGLVAVLASAGAAGAAITVTYDAGPFSSVALGNGGVETFDAATLGLGTLASTFGAYSGTYTGIQVNPADQYTASSLHNYAVTFSYTSAYTLALTSGVNYFGFYNEAADNSNTVNFYSGGVGGTLVGTYHSSIADQQRAFVNVRGSQTFDTIVFSDTLPANQGTHGFETDNHTVAMVPEPASWALMILGFGGVGVSLRNRRRAAVATA
jgi:hypothetical protein